MKKKKWEEERKENDCDNDDDDNGYSEVNMHTEWLVTSHYEWYFNNIKLKSPLFLLFTFNSNERWRQ